MEVKLRGFFEDNYQRLREEGGHALSESAKEEAWEQVLWYWRKLHGLANKVTDTEVRLSLPNQKTPAGLPFSIDGIVDIIREDGTAKMYDIKTHDLDAVNGNIELYEEQLNVYAHIWQELRGNPLDIAAVISTAFPKEMKQAIRSGDAAKVKKEFDKWEPIVPIEIKSEKVAETIKAFGTVIDAIEEGHFSCPPATKLKEKFPGTNKTFAYKVCLNCDGRYCCESYRTFASAHVSGKARELVKYFQKDFEKEQQEDWLESNTSPVEEAI